MGRTALLSVALIAVAALLARAGAPRTDRLAPLPRIVLWAWERPENLAFIDPAELGVAYLDRTVYLEGDSTQVRLRLQPLSVAPGTKLLAVARIETSPSQPPSLSSRQRKELVGELVPLATRAGVSAIQIDFDATRSERGFYALVLADLRSSLPPSMPISITALASWCIGDPWIAGLPIQEAVPMLFRMGPDDGLVRRRLSGHNPFSVPVCRHSAGISTDEPLPPLPSGSRVYIFSPLPWSQASVQVAIRKVKSWF
jgi:hypothetical protein